MEKTTITSEINELIRSGQASRARKKILSLAKKRLPRSLKAPLARLAWRTDCPETGIRLLFRLVRPRAHSPVHPSPGELAEFAACLIRLGASREGLHLLSKLNPRDYPYISLYRAFGLFNQWAYGEAIPHLLAYCDQDHEDEYQVLVAQVNLVAAYLFVRKTVEATELLESLYQKTRSPDRVLLRGNIRELTAQNLMLKKEWYLARKLLIAAKGDLRQTGGTEAFFIDKWIAATHVFQDPTSRTKTKIHEVRVEAIRRNLGEVARDCDRIEALATNDRELYTQVYYGTRFGPYREKLLAEWEGKPIADSYLKSGTNQSPELILELETGTVSRRGKLTAKLKPGQLVHRLLQTLCSDSYRPFSIPVLFDELYPDSFYHPSSASARVHNAIQRLRIWLNSNRIPIRIAFSRGHCFLSLESSCGVEMRRLFLEGKTDQRERFYLRELREQYSQKTFGSKNLEIKFGLSQRSVQRVLKKLIQAGHLRKSGHGPATKYQLETR